MENQPSLTSPSLLSSLSFPSPASVAPLIVVPYDLRDGTDPYPALATDIVRLPPSALISDLKRAVFEANANTLRGRDYTQLDVYPPGNTEWTARSPAKPRDTIASVPTRVAAPDDTFVVVARPLPSFGGARGQSSHSPQQRALHVMRPSTSPPFTLPAATGISSVG